MRRVRAIVRAARRARRDRRGSRRGRVPALDHAVEPAGVSPGRGGDVLNAYTLSTSLRDEDGARFPSTSARSTTTRTRSIRTSLQPCSRSPARTRRSRAGCPRCSCLPRCSCSGCSPGGSRAATRRSRGGRSCRDDTVALRARTRRARGVDAAATRRAPPALARALLAACALDHPRGDRRRPPARVARVLVHGKPPARARCSRPPSRSSPAAAAGGSAARVGDVRGRARADRRVRTPPSRRAHRAVRGDDDRARRPVGAAVVAQAIGNWFKDVDPWHWATAGDPGAVHPQRRLRGAVRRRRRARARGCRARRRPGARELWWRYVLLATLLVPIPAALTVDRYNAIRLATLPVFVLVLAIPALAALIAAARTSWPARAVAAVLALTVAVQYVQFLDIYRTRGPAGSCCSRRASNRCSRSRSPPASRSTSTTTTAARRRGALAGGGRGVPQERIVVLPDGGIPPPGSLVFLRFQDCDFECEDVASWEEYWLARAAGS